MPVSRNAPCPCGSGKKYKHCCYGVEQSVRSKHSRKQLVVLLLLVILMSAGAVWWLGWDTGIRAGVLGVILLGGYMILRNPPGTSGRSDKGANIDFGH